MKKLNAHVLFESSDGNTPHGSSYIRLLRPLGHPTNHDSILLSSSSSLPQSELDVVIVDRLWRPGANDQALVDDQEQLLSELERRHVPLIYSIDDNLLDPSGDDGLLSFPTPVQRMVCRRFIRAAAGVIVSTDGLARRLSNLAERIAVLPNQLDEALFDPPRTAPPRPEHGRLLRCGYMGTFTHFKDLLSISQPLRALLSRYENQVQLEFVGIANTASIQSLFESRNVLVRQVPNASVEYPAFARWMRQEVHWDFAIAPLGASVINSTKSDIKFLDYGILGIPGIFSDCEAYQGTVRDRETGMLARSSPDSWMSAFEAIVQDNALRHRLSEACRDYVWQYRTLRSHARKWVDAIQQFLRAHQHVSTSTGPDAANRPPAAIARSPRPGVSDGSAPSTCSAVGGRCWEPVPNRPLSRREKLVWCIEISGVGLEIGPGYSPLLPKREGYSIETIDHGTANQLREKYAKQDVDTTQIEEVDFVWRGEPLDELTRRRHHYDFIVASHVLEHTTDLVGFVRQCAAMLKPAGVLLLAVPDCRYCFDLFRGFTTTGDVLQAFLERRSRHTPGTVFDHFSLAAFVGGKPSWDRDAVGSLDFAHSFEDAHAMYLRAQSREEYLDVHNWRFTPSSFRLLFADLRRLGLIELSERVMFDTEGCEFIVHLSRDGSPKHGNRLELVEQIKQEMSNSTLPPSREVSVRVRGGLHSPV